ncbi:SpoIIE family protein phosphatase [Desulfovibrio psychrotolerans]|uniref:PPM-type phosphatase domain-containing protein n=1 Tax=Desulfovibrio psychrotolerans TaxID=415242 RepID=A0A7J0BTP8_9BACT|nr:SpoIIE family protein phosphatase [Desulfovibrio psychrotolerans]GFM36561.1 hypothetical protein DSM19430T_12450 [Desulfovibrio psychrotolerans]
MKSDSSGSRVTGGLYARILDYAAGLRTVTKMKIILALCLILCPLVLLLLHEGMSHTQLGNLLAGWIAAGFIVLIPLSHFFAHILALRSVKELNALCGQMREGNLTPFESLPPEPTDNDALQTLRHNLFWIGHIIDSRQKALNGALRNLNEAQARQHESIEYASVIQNAFLPAEATLHELFAEHFLLWSQRDTVGGDAYWVRRARDGFFVAVVDCTGHGVPGAFMTLIVHSLFERLDTDALRADPAGVIGAMNRAIRGALAQDRANSLSDDGMDCTVLFVDEAARTLHFAGARHSLFMLPAGIHGGDGEGVEIRGDRCGVGYVRTPEDYVYTNHVLPLQAGTRYYCLTDGLTDQVGGANGLPFGKSRFLSFIRENGNVPLARQRTLLEATLKEYMGRETRRDDVTVLGFTV